MDDWKTRIKENRIILIGVLSVAAVLAVAGTFYLGGEMEVAPPEDGLPGTAEASVVATVNGEEITQSEVSELQQTFALQGQQMSEQDAIELAIDRKILAQEAERQGYAPSIQEVEEIIGVQLAQQGATIDDLREQLRARGISYEKTLDDFQSEVAMQQYVQAAVPIPEVSSAEAREFYELNKEQLVPGDQTPPYEQVENEITSFLQVQKQEEAISTLIQQLRVGADIVYY